MNKNYLKVEVSKPNQKVFIMTGLPGSGKSTKASELAKSNGIIHSTDDVIVELYGDYDKVFTEAKETNNSSKIGKAHHRNFLNFKESIDSGVENIVVDNTNLRPRDPKVYVKYALESGLSDENIQIIVVDFEGLTLEDLANRNSHNVSLEVITKMNNRFQGNKPLTIKKIMESKDKKVTKWAYLKLDDKSKTKLLTATKHYIPKDFKVFGHHMTINFGKGLPKELKGDLGSLKNLTATHIGISDMAIAVKVEGYTSTNNIAHVTIGVSPNGEPKMSNDITNWKQLTSKINLTGVIEEKTFSN
jgi:predicted kinase